VPCIAAPANCMAPRQVFGPVLIEGRWPAAGGSSAPRVAPGHHGVELGGARRPAAMESLAGLSYLPTPYAATWANVARPKFI
jgi:hypothetical protein